MLKAFVADLKSNTRATVIELLNARLADAIDLKLAVKQAHWNIRGPSFIARVVRPDRRSHGGAQRHHGRTCRSVGRPRRRHNSVCRKSHVAAGDPAEATVQSEHPKALRERLAAFAKACRAAIETADGAGDADTADIMTGISRAIDKDLWFVAAHLE